MRAPGPVPSNLLLHMHTNWREPPSICRARSPFIILTTRDHYRGFKALFHHSNAVSSPCHFVWDMLRDGAQAKKKNLEAGATNYARKVLVMLDARYKILQPRGGTNKLQPEG